MVPKNKPPSKITISDIIDYIKFCEKVTIAFGEENMTYRAISNCNVLIAVKTDQHFRNSIELLKHLNAKYYTHTLKAGRPYRVVVRGLYPNINIDLIKHDFKNMGHIPTNIVNIKKTIKIIRWSTKLPHLLHHKVKVQSCTRSPPFHNVNGAKDETTLKATVITQCDVSSVPNHTTPLRVSTKG
ncbi:hypothetical protein PGB90_004625 [Kerria lacca]